VNTKITQMLKFGGHKEVRAFTPIKIFKKNPNKKFKKKIKIREGEKDHSN